MKSRMKCFSFLALIVFGFGHSDLLVRNSWAHHDRFTSNPITHWSDHELIRAVETIATGFALVVYLGYLTAEEILEAYGRLQDFIEKKRQEQLRLAALNGPPSTNVNVPVGPTAPTFCTECCQTHDPNEDHPASNCPQDRRP